MTTAELRALLAKHPMPTPHEADAGLAIAAARALPALLDVAEAAREVLAGWEGAACVVSPPCGGCDACQLSIAVAKLETS